MLIAHGGLLVCLAVFAVLYVKLARDQYTDHKTLHLVTLLLGFSLACQFAAVACELVHLLVYQHDGLGLRFRHTWFALDFFSQVFQQASELSVAFVLICVAAGWTLSGSFSMAAFLSSPKGIASIGLSSLASLILQLAGRKYEDDFSSFHNHEHWPGVCLMVLRTLLGLVFLLSLARSLGYFSALFLAASQPFPPPHARLVQLLTIAHGRPGYVVSAGDENGGGGAVEGLRSVVQFVGLLGGIWFLSFPACGLVSGLLHPASRHAFVTSVTLIAQCTVLGFLVHAFLDKSSAFSKASSIRTMGTVFSLGAAGAAGGHGGGGMGAGGLGGGLGGGGESNTGLGSSSGLAALNLARFIKTALD